MKLGETLGKRRHRSKGAEACEPLALGRELGALQMRGLHGDMCRQQWERLLTFLTIVSLRSFYLFIFWLIFFSVDFPSGSACWKCSHVIQFFFDMFRFGHCDKIFEVISSKRGKICSGRLFQIDTSNLWARSHICPRTAMNVAQHICRGHLTTVSKG